MLDFVCCDISGVVPGQNKFGVQFDLFSMLC